MLLRSRTLLRWKASLHRSTIDNLSTSPHPSGVRYSTHLVFAGCCYSLIAKAGLPSHDGLGLATAMAASMLPDLDCPGSYIGRKLPFISRPLGMLLGHRGFSHSLLCAVLVGTTFSYASHTEFSLLAAVAIGYLSHILGDYLCDSGIPLWWPKNKRISFRYAIRTGSATEHTITSLLLIAFTAMHFYF